MSSGASELKIEGRTHRRDWDTILEVVRNAWPDGLLKLDTGAGEGNLFEMRLERVPKGRMEGNEVLFYKTWAALNAWKNQDETAEDEGQEFENDVLYVLMDIDSIVFLSHGIPLVGEIAAAIELERKRWQ